MNYSTAIATGVFCGVVSGIFINEFYSDTSSAVTILKGIGTTIISGVLIGIIMFF